MRGIVKFLQERVSGRGLIIEPEPTSGDPSAQADTRRPGHGAAAAAIPAIAAEINSRDEVVRLLDRICALLREVRAVEPSARC